MIRRSLMAALAAAVLPMTAFASDAGTLRGERPVRARLELREIFSLAPGVISEGRDGITIGPMEVQVLLARVGPDGKLIRSCVDNEAAARAFLDAPIERLDTPKAKQQ